MTASVRDEVLKFAPLLRNRLYGLDRAADHLLSWIDGSTQLEELLDVSACQG